MTKEQYLAMSLPYGLKMYINSQFGDFISILAYSNFSNNLQNGITVEACINLDANPILHPLSDIIKSITHKGETFVPLIELAKIALKSDFIYSRFHNDSDGFYVESKDNFVFAYCDKKYCFGMYRYHEIFTITNQLQLFQKLIEWHFDLFGGIDNGEAINVNTLDKNPYE